jgi:hypothetical protein
MDSTKRPSLKDKLEYEFKPHNEMDGTLEQKTYPLLKGQIDVVFKPWRRVLLGEPYPLPYTNHIVLS